MSEDCNRVGSDARPPPDALLGHETTLEHHKLPRSGAQHSSSLAGTWKWCRMRHVVARADEMTLESTAGFATELAIVRLRKVLYAY